MIVNLLTPREVDHILRYPAGRTLRLAMEGRLPHLLLPDGQVRFREADIQQLLEPRPAEGSRP